MKQNRTARAPVVCLRVAVAFALIATVTSATAAEPKRVLIINSFGSAAPPFSIHETSFESELVKNLGETVALDEVSLDLARHDDPKCRKPWWITWESGRPNGDRTWSCRSQHPP